MKSKSEMAVVSVRIPRALLEAIREKAETSDRAVSQEILHRLKTSLAEEEKGRPRED